MKQSLVTISIPTYNSEAFIKKCLGAIRSQTYPDIEINIVDGHSKDQTLAEAKKEKVTHVYTSNDALLQARYIGVKEAKGEFVLLLDSDQILRKDTIKRAVEACFIEDYDMLILEEGVFEADSIIETLFQEDRKLVHSIKDFSPFTGVMLPRFYRKKLLLQALENIPPHIRKTIGGQDHAIIYFEAWKLSQKVGFLSHAVDHIEPDSLPKIWKKFYRWGKTSVNARYGEYGEMLSQKERFRTGLFRKGLIKASLASICLLILKGIPYKLGYFAGRKHNS